MARSIKARTLAPSESFDSWESAQTAFLAEHGQSDFQPGDSDRFKRWIGKQHGRYDREGLRQAAIEWRKRPGFELPADLLDLREKLIHLAADR